MLNEFNFFLKICLISVSFLSSACSSAEHGEFEKVRSFLMSNQAYYGLQGCTYNGHIFFRGTNSGAAGIFQYNEIDRTVKDIKNFSYIGPLICSEDGIYFSAKNDVMRLYRYSGNDLEVLSENIDCSVVSKDSSGQFSCFRDEGFDGSYSLGTFDVYDKKYNPSFSTEKFGLSEGIFLSSGGVVMGVFFDDKTGFQYLKIVDLGGGREVSSMKLDCDMISALSVANGMLIYKCGSYVGAVSSTLE